MEMQEMMERLLARQAKAEANQEKMLTEIRADRKAYREDLKSDQAKMIAAFKGKMDTWIANIKDAQRETTTCQEVTGANAEKMEPNSGGDRNGATRDS
jgi:Skp family chaperone for outer membrane proteins